MREPLKAFKAKKYNDQICISKKKSAFQTFNSSKKSIENISSKADSKGYYNIRRQWGVTKLLTVEIKIRSRPQRFQWQNQKDLRKNVFKYRGFPDGASGKDPHLPMQEMEEMQVRSLGPEDTLEEEMATSSSILAWRVPWTEEPGGLQSPGSHWVGHNWSNLAHKHLFKYPISPISKPQPELSFQNANMIMFPLFKTLQCFQLIPG